MRQRQPHLHHARTAASRRGRTRIVPGLCAALVAAAAIAAMPLRATAQQQFAPTPPEATIVFSGVQLETGLFTVARGQHALQVTVTELGAFTASSHVSVIFYGPDDREIGRGTGTLGRRRPVRVPLRIGDVGPVQVRATIRISGLAGRGSVPYTVLEDLDADDFTIGTRWSCAAPAGREGPVTLAVCPEFVVSSFTTGL